VKPRRPNTHSSHERWLVSYADFITLLFAFFVVLYASAQVDKKRVNRLSAAIENAFQELGTFSGSKRSGVNAAPDPAQVLPIQTTEMQLLEQQLTAALAPELARREVDIHHGPDGLVVSLREVGFFDSVSAVMRPQASEAFHRIGLVLQWVPYRIRVEGHTDDVPIHNRRFASNWELSTARATEVTRLLIEDYNFDPRSLAAAGYAEFHPVAENSSPEGRSSNRRVDLVIQREMTTNPNPLSSR
jgi:chemotaxis protein MotB